jgi:hypothetical protein
VWDMRIDRTPVGDDLEEAKVQASLLYAAWEGNGAHEGRIPRKIIPL